MPARDIIVVGGSAGSLTALVELVRGLPADFPAAIFVVMHVSPQSPGLLHEILNRAGKLPAAKARHGDAIRRGRILVAPPDHHLLLDAGSVRVMRGPRENRFRPAVDPLFRSAADAYGPRVAAVILSGMLDDGTHGLSSVKQHGGIAIVQDTAEAPFCSMPASALAHVDVDYVASLADMASLLQQLVRGAADGRDCRAAPRFQRANAIAAAASNAGFHVGGRRHAQRG